MRLVRLILILLPAVCSVSLYSRAFELKGWEYGACLSNETKPVSADDIHFLQSAQLNKNVFLFYRTGDSLCVSLFKNGRIASSRKALPIDDYTAPVVKEDGESILILTFLNGALHLYRMKDIGKIDEVFSFAYPLGYNYDLFVTDNSMVISLPSLKDNRYTVKALIINKKERPYRAKQADFTGLDEKDKGIFYFRVFPEKNRYRAFFIRRYYDSQSKVIGDSLFTFEAGDLTQMKNVKPAMLVPHGLFDQPPEILRSAGDATNYILFSRKRGSVYSFRLVSDRSKIEYTVSKSFINAYYPRYFYAGDSLDFFYLGNLDKITRIYNNRIDLTRLNDPSYQDTESGNTPATPPETKVSAFSTCSVSGEKYLFYINENDRLLYYTRNDVSAPAVKITAQIIREKDLSHYCFNWNKAEDPSGIFGYAYLIDKKPDTVPVIVNLSPSDRLVTTKQLDKGTYYFHIRAVDSLGNAGPVQHVRFEAGKTGPLRLPDLSAQDNSGQYNRWLDSIDQALNAVNGELRLTNSYDLILYRTLLGYYRDISQNIQDRDFPAAENALNRCVLIDGHQFETSLYLQLLKNKEENIAYKYPLSYNTLVFLLLMTVLVLVYFGVSKL